MSVSFTKVECVMSYFKKFGDFCSGFACFSAIIYLFRQYMMFDAKDAELMEKVKMFFDKNVETDNRLMLVLVVMLVLSVVASIVLRRLPYLIPMFSVPPLLLAVDMFRSGFLREYPMMYLLLLCIAVISHIWECVSLDSRFGRHRAAFAGDAMSALCAAVMLIIWKRGNDVFALESKDALLLNAFDYEIWSGAKNMNMRLFLVMGCAYLGMILISLLLTDVYFIDAALAAVPCIAGVYMWSADKLTVHAEIAVTLSLVVLVARLIPTFSGKREIKSTATEEQNIEL